MRADVQYEAARDITVGRGEIRKKGELVPEAKTWKNVKAWVDKGFVRERKGGPSSPSLPPVEAQTEAPLAADVVATEHTAADLHRMLKAGVIEVATALGLTGEGTKDDLIEAVLEAQQAQL